MTNESLPLNLDDIEAQVGDAVARGVPLRITKGEVASLCAALRAERASNLRLHAAIVKLHAEGLDLDDWTTDSPAWTGQVLCEDGHRYYPDELLVERNEAKAELEQLRGQAQQCRAELADLRAQLAEVTQEHVADRARADKAEKQHGLALVAFDAIKVELDRERVSKAASEVVAAALVEALVDARGKLQSAQHIADGYVTAARTVDETNWRPFRDRVRESLSLATAALSTTAGADLLARHRAALESLRERAAKVVLDGLAFSSVAPASRIATAIRSLPLELREGENT